MSIDIYVKWGLVTHAELPDGVDEYLLRDYDIPLEEQDFLQIPESDYPDLVIDLKGGRVVDVWNNTGYDYHIFDDDI